MVKGQQLYKDIKAVRRLGRRWKYSQDELERAVGKPALRRLDGAGFVEEQRNGHVYFRNCIWRPAKVIGFLLPSLRSLKEAKTFDGEPMRAFRMLDGSVTLDYAAWELTGYQMPHALHVYVDDLPRARRHLVAAGFRPDDPKGRVCLLPRYGNFRNRKQRIYWDSVAYGGRSLLDAAALELLYPDDVRIRAELSAQLLEKVREEVGLEKRL